MPEYVGSLWLTSLGFYSRGSGSVLRKPSRTFSKGFARALLPGDLLAGLVLALVFSWFSAWGVQKRIYPPRHFVVEQSWPLYVHHKLCCGCGCTICHLVMTSFHASHNWKADQKCGRNYSLFLEGEFWTLFLFQYCSVPQFWPLLSEVALQMFLW